ncbi:uncharacterized protein [Ptychodera flava]|uniref:uncharacterized protein n=1 Tax=Ptychodera flava TaxID=63121 RepID=UPI00396A1576
MPSGDDNEVAVIVQNIPEDVQEGELWDYFFQEQNGGGEVNSIEYIEDSCCAIVVFQSEEVAKRVASTTHSIHDTRLFTGISSKYDVEGHGDGAYRLYWSDDDDDTDDDGDNDHDHDDDDDDSDGDDEILYTRIVHKDVAGDQVQSDNSDSSNENKYFGEGPFVKVEATITRRVLEKFGPLEDVLRMLSDQSGVITRKGRQQIVVIGALDQINHVEQLLGDQKVSRRVGAANRVRSVDVLPQRKKGVDTIIPPYMFHRDSTARPKSAHHSLGMPHKAIKVQELPRLYLIFCFKETLREIQDKCHVLILYRGDESVIFHPCIPAQGAQIDEAYRTYSSLYSHVANDLQEEKVDCPSQQPLDMIKRLVTSSYPGVMLHSGDKGTDTALIVGILEDDVAAAVTMYHDISQLDESELTKMIKEIDDQVDPFKDNVDADSWEKKTLKSVYAGPLAATEPGPLLATDIATTSGVGSTASNDATSSGIQISILTGDICKETVDIIVNAANNRLEHIGGVALAILKAAGEIIQKESNEYIKKHGKLSVGDVVESSPGKLKCMNILHAVGPRWKETPVNQRRQLLSVTYDNILRKANKLKASSIAMPMISAGIYGYPKKMCVEVVYQSIMDFTAANPSSILRYIRLIDRSSEAVQALQNYFTRKGVSPHRLCTTETHSVVRGVHDEKDDESNQSFRSERANQKMKTRASSKTADVEEVDNTCKICISDIVDGKQLSKCKHRFCRSCIDEALKHDSRCPLCREPQREMIGNQPSGTMTHHTDRSRGLPGYERFGVIVIDYHIPSGIQSEDHPSPGRWFQGTSRTAYLPENREGREVLDLLHKAFDNRLIFTVGTSHTSGLTDCVVWNDIHHKTSRDGGPAAYGYPDEDYLRRVKDELASKGIK